MSAITLSWKDLDFGSQDAQQCGICHTPGMWEFAWEDGVLKEDTICITCEKKYVYNDTTDAYSLKSYLPYTLDSLLAKQNLFYDECNEVAQTIADEIIEAKRENEEDEDLEEFIYNGIRDHAVDMMAAYADDLINSYGIARAVRLYLADCEEQGFDPHDEDQWDMYSQSIVMVIIEKPVVERVKGLLLEYRRSK